MKGGGLLEEREGELMCSKNLAHQRQGKEKNECQIIATLNFASVVKIRGREWGTKNGYYLTIVGVMYCRTHT